MPSSGMPRMTSAISERLRSMVSNTFSACSWATSSVRSISRSAVSLIETQETLEAKMKSASGRATEAAIIHCSSLSELRCAVCKVAPSRKRSLLQSFARNKVDGHDGTSPSKPKPSWPCPGHPRLAVFSLCGHRDVDARDKPGHDQSDDRPRSNLPLDHLQLELGDRFRRVEALWAGLCAIHDGVAAIEPERILEIVEPLAGGLIAAIGDPSRRLQQRGRAEKTFAVPPIARARGRAAGAQDAFVEPVEFFAVLVALF